MPWKPFNSQAAYLPGERRPVSLGRSVSSSCSAGQQLIWQLRGRTAAALVRQCHIRQHQYARRIFFLSVCLFFPVAGCSESYFMADWIAWELQRERAPCLGPSREEVLRGGCFSSLHPRFGVCLAGKKLSSWLLIPGGKMNNKAKELQVSSGQRR